MDSSESDVDAGRGMSSSAKNYAKYKATYRKNRTDQQKQKEREKGVFILTIFIFYIDAEQKMNLRQLVKDMPPPTIYLAFTGTNDGIMHRAERLKTRYPALYWAGYFVWSGRDHGFNMDAYKLKWARKLERAKRKGTEDLSSDDDFQVINTKYIC